MLRGGELVADALDGRLGDQAGGCQPDDVELTGSDHG